MNCEVAQNRLLALPDPRRVTAELRAHLDGCAACRAYAAGVVRLDALLAELPVPPSLEETKAAFLDQVTAAGPVITRVPVVPRRDSSAQLKALLARTGVKWKHVAGLAAGLLVAVGGYWVVTGNKPTPQPEFAYRRHELLNRQTQSIARLAQADTPAKKLDAWAGVTDDLRAEAKALHKVAPDDDLQALTRMFRRAVEEGVVPQARTVADQPAAPAERQAALKAAIDRLTAAEVEAGQLANTAPPHARKQLLRMAEIARDGRTRLQTLAGGA